jgi:hypothetical protein
MNFCDYLFMFSYMTVGGQSWSGLLSLQEIIAFLTGNFGKKKTPIWFFCPHVQLDQNAIMDKLFWT